MAVSLFVAGRRLRLCHNAAGCSGLLTLTRSNHSTTRSRLIIRSINDNTRVTSCSQFNPSFNVWGCVNNRSNNELLQSVVAPRFLSSSLSSQAQPPPTSARQENEEKAQQQCEKDKEKPEPSSSQRRNNSNRRQRHKFLRAPGDLDNVPSFAEFQQQQRVKSLYRQYLRLIYQKFIVTASSSSDKNNKSSHRDEMIAQVRYEFKSNNAKEMSPWDVKRAMSEGSRRYKELSSMLGNSVVVNNTEKTANSASNDDENISNDDENDSLTASSSTLDNSGKSPWPWQQQQQIKGTKEEPHHRPSWSPPYPSKSVV